MTIQQLIITIAAIVLGTVITRFLPFILFPNSQKAPSIIMYLGKVLPHAAMGMLVVYCLKDIQPLMYPHGLPELMAAACVVALHIWRRNTLLSIGAGTAAYMVLLRLVF